MKKTKNELGITLVALIITIIVLLILAIVSIRAIQQGGIIGKSQNAVGSYEDKRVEEENRLNEYETIIDQHQPQNMEEKFLNRAYAFYSRESNLIVVYYLFKDGAGVKLKTNGFDATTKERIPDDSESGMGMTLDVNLTSDFNSITIKVEDENGNQNLVQLTPENAIEIEGIGDELNYVTENAFYCRIKDGQVIHYHNEVQLLIYDSSLDSKLY